MRISKRSIVFMCLVVIIGFALNFVLTPYSYVDLQLKSAKKTGENYDFVIMGQSHAEFCYNPYILDETLNVNSYDLGRRWMSVADTYYYLKEWCKNNTVKYLIYDLDSSYWSSRSTNKVMEDTYMLYHTSGLNTLSYLTSKAWNEDFSVVLSPYGNITESKLKDIPASLDKKLALMGSPSQETINKQLSASTFNYIGKGYKAGITKNPTGYVFEYWYGPRTEVIDYFEKIVNFCKENNIQLICTSTPLPTERLMNENYTDVHNFFSSLAASYNLPYFDFNYINDQYYQKYPEDFMDSDGHMFGTASDRFTNTLATMIYEYNAGSDMGKFFH